MSEGTPSDFAAAGSAAANPAAADFAVAMEELQRLIDEEARATYSPQVIQEASHPQNVGRMEDPDGAAIVRGPCGDTMEICLRVQDGRISESTFMTDGCGPTVACGSLLTSMARGMSLQAAWEILADDLLAALGGLPSENEHCAHLAVNTLHEALAGYQRRSKTLQTVEEVSRRAGDLMRRGYS
ncbi:MAG TPA: iron-sulfur cluster assembly scaffold protein [Anaerolineae bacterium]|jgi:nitrogen fixation NifU-like protein|nr:iron-sulfur cluster assembly scaffold protein [Anaerolineae bacterium]